MAIKTQFSVKDFKKILSVYSLGEFVSYSYFKSGHVQTNILIKTTRGKFVLRYYETRKRKYIQCELNILDYLYKHNYLSPIPIHNIHGKVLGVFNNKHYALFKYIEGKHIQKLNREQREEMLRNIAKLHTITLGYKPKYFEYREFHDKNHCITTSKIESKKFKNKKIAKERLQYVEKQLSLLQFPKKLSKGIVHCDYDVANMKFQKNKLVGVLDFDDACYTYLIYDLGILIYYWCWVREDQQILNFKKAKNFIQLYMKYRQISKVEKEHIYDALKMVILTYAAWFFHDKHKNKDIFEKSKKRLEFLNKLGREEFYRRIFD